MDAHTNQKVSDLGEHGPCFIANSGENLMTRINYEFEELELIDGLNVWAYGSADIVGEWQPAGRDVGIMSPYFEYEIEAIYLQKSHEKGQTELKKDDPVYQLIEKALHSDKYESLINAELEETSEPDPDDAYDRMRDDRVYQQMYGD
jgi:hypothetical protein